MACQLPRVSLNDRRCSCQRALSRALSDTKADDRRAARSPFVNYESGTTVDPWQLLALIFRSTRSARWNGGAVPRSSRILARVCRLNSGARSAQRCTDFTKNSIGIRISLANPLFDPESDLARSSFVYFIPKKIATFYVFIFHNV